MLDEVHGVEQLAQSLERVVLALEGYQQRVRGRQHVERDEPERRRAVDEDEVVLVADRLHRVSHPLLPLRRVDELYLGTRQIRRGGHDIQVLKLDSPQAGAPDVSRSDEDVVGRALEGATLDAGSTRRISLRIAVDQQGASLGDGEAGGEVYGGGGLPHPALLVGDRDDSGH